MKPFREFLHSVLLQEASSRSDAYEMLVMTDNRTGDVNKKPGEDRGDLSKRPIVAAYFYTNEDYTHFRRWSEVNTNDNENYYLYTSNIVGDLGAYGGEKVGDNLNVPLGDRVLSVGNSKSRTMKPVHVDNPSLIKAIGQGDPRIITSFILGNYPNDSAAKDVRKSMKNQVLPLTPEGSNKKHTEYTNDPEDFNNIKTRRAKNQNNKIVMGYNTIVIEIYKLSGDIGQEIQRRLVGQFRVAIAGSKARQYKKENGYYYIDHVQDEKGLRAGDRHFMVFQDSQKQPLGYYEYDSNKMLYALSDDGSSIDNTGKLLKKFAETTLFGDIMEDIMSKRGAFEPKSPFYITFSGFNGKTETLVLSTGDVKKHLIVSKIKTQKNPHFTQQDLETLAETRNFGEFPFERLQNAKEVKKPVKNDLAANIAADAMKKNKERTTKKPSNINVSGGYTNADLDIDKLTKGIKDIESKGEDSNPYDSNPYDDDEDNNPYSF